MSTLLFLNIGVPELIMVLIAFLAYPVLMIYCLVDIVRSNFKDSTTKLLWVLIVLFAPFLGSLIYFAIGRKNKIF